MFEDEKIKLIEQMPDADTILIIWVKLLSQAGKTNGNGYIYLSENIPYTDEMLSTIFGRPLNTIRLALETFKAFGMIEIDDENFISIANWEKHQNVEGLDRIREQTRIRQARYRKNKKIEQKKDDKDEDNEGSDVTVTSRNAPEEELEEELDKERDKEIKTVGQPKKKVSQNLNSLEEIETFVDLKINVLPSGVSKKILINYIDCIRLRRATCRISSNLVSKLLEKFAKCSTDQLNYAMWTHFDKHDDKDEKYTLGILRNTKEPEAKRGLMKLKNGNGGVDIAANKRGASGNDALQSKIDATNERRKRIAGIESNRDVDVPF